MAAINSRSAISNLPLLHHLINTNRIPPLPGGLAAIG
jgi:hypothetical protein